MAAADQKKRKKKKKKVHFITSLLFLAVSDIPWDSSLSSQALALFLSYFI